MQSFRLIIQHLAAPRRPVEQPLAEAGGLCGRSMLIAVASLCQSVSMLSALALHLITHSLIHSLIQLLTPSRTAAAGQAVSPTFLSKQQHCPLLVRLICHLDRKTSHLSNDCTEQFLTLTPSH